VGGRERVSLALDGRTGNLSYKRGEGACKEFADGSKAGGMWETRGGLWTFSKCAQLPIFLHPVSIMGETLANTVPTTRMHMERDKRKERVDTVPTTRMHMEREKRKERVDCHE
jgi:hypothetical protein